MLILYAMTLFVSALLLFLVQPMVGKMILPSLGGTPAVWNTCMVFFQAALLAGYAYAHGTTRLLGVRRQAVVHLVILALPVLLSVAGLAAVLPIAIDTSSVPTQEDNPLGWLLLRLALGVGLPFFIMSSSAPILQTWFSHTRHRAAHDPYFLYAASNTGSLLALLGYPLAYERLLPLPHQSLLWYGGYVLLFVLTLACAVTLWRSSTRPVEAGESLGATPTNGADARPAAAAPVTVGRRLHWIALAFVPSSLMLGATVHITTDIAPVPLLWVVPLAIYLLSFILVFGRRMFLTQQRVRMIFPFVIAPVAILTVLGGQGVGWFPLVAHLVALFVTAMVCHGAMADDRPASRHLTEFYLCMSVGGVLGGLFNAVVAPLAFDSILEYPLVMVLACLVITRREELQAKAANWALHLATPLAMAAVVGGLLWVLRYGVELPSAPIALTVIVVAAFCIAVERFWHSALRFGLCLAVAMVTVSVFFELADTRVIYAGRNFYGEKSVRTNASESYHEFAHGTTVHGAQWTDPRGQDTPLTYFHPTGPVGNVFKVYEYMRVPRRVAVVGLGVGSMAAYGERRDHFVFYEIDPEVERIARDPAFFTYLQRCKATWEVILGDGRLTIADADDGSFGLIFLDAFASDAVPTHLLTAEALQLYLSKLDEDGMLVFNVSNRFLELTPLLARLAEDAGLACWHRYDRADVPGKTGFPLKRPSHFVVMARDERTLSRLNRFPDWVPATAPPDMRAWTDQYSSIFSVVSWRSFEQAAGGSSDGTQP